MRLTRATDDQVEEILEIDRAWSSNAPHEDTAWWCLDGDPALAYCGAYVDEDGLNLERAWVCPELRGRRMQRRLIRARERWGRSRGCVRSLTYTSTASVPSYRALIRCGYLPYRYTFSEGAGWIHWERALT